MVKKKTKHHMVGIHEYIAGKKYIIQYTLVDLAPIAFSLFTTWYFTKQCGQWGLFFKIIFLSTNIHYEGDGFEIRINCPMRGLSFSRSF